MHNFHTEIIQVDRERPDPAAIDRAAACLRSGGLVAFPTETVYGLGVHALDRAAVLRLFAAKQRPANDPLIVHISSLDDARSLTTSIPEAAIRLAARFWPGPLTMVMRRAPAVPMEVTAGLDTVAVRVPAHPVARALLDTARVPVAAPSANLFSRPSPTQGAHVLEDLDGRIDIVIDAGPTDVGVESTVIDLTGPAPTVLRPGAVGLDALREVVPDVVEASRTQGSAPHDLAEASAPHEHAPMPSPGLLSKHYAPRAPLTLYYGETERLAAVLRTSVENAVAAGHRVGVLATRDEAAALRDLPVVIADVGAADDMAAIASRLYAALRELDAQSVDVIFARVPAGDDALARAIHDRLRRAAARAVRVD